MSHQQWLFFDLGRWTPTITISNVNSYVNSFAKSNFLKILNICFFPFCQLLLTIWWPEGAGDLGGDDGSKLMEPKKQQFIPENFFYLHCQIFSEAKWKLWLLPNDFPWSLLRLDQKTLSTLIHLFLHEVIFCPKPAGAILIKSKKPSEL